MFQLLKHQARLHQAQTCASSLNAMVRIGKTFNLEWLAIVSGHAVCGWLLVAWNSDLTPHRGAASLLPGLRRSGLVSFDRGICAINMSTGHTGQASLLWKGNKLASQATVSLNNVLDTNYFHTD